MDTHTDQRIEVLLTDDSEVERLYLRRMLEKAGVSVDEATSGDECVRKAGTKQYDCILIDLLMPGMSGIRTLAELRASTGLVNEKTPAVALGASEDCAPGESLETAGFAACLEKPVRIGVLAGAMVPLLSAGKAQMLQRSGVLREGARPKAAGMAPGRAVEPSGGPAPGDTGQQETLPDWLLAAEDLNPQEGIANCGSGEGYLAALEIFYSTIEKKAAEIREYLAKEDWKNYTIKVHALKSSARIIGAARLSERAKVLEAAGNALDLDAIRKDTAPMLEQYEKYLKSLRPIAGGETEEGEEKPEAPAEQLADAYGALTEYADSMDYELAEMVLKSMDEYRLPAPHDEVFRELNAKLLDLDWEGVKRLAEENRI